MENAFKAGHPVELGSQWIYPDTNVWDLMEKLGVNHDTTGYNWDTLGLYSEEKSMSSSSPWSSSSLGGGELSETEKSLLVDETYLEDFVGYADKMASDGVSWTDIKQQYFLDRGGPEFDNTKRQ